MREQAVVYTDLTDVLVGREGDTWERQRPPR